MAFKTLDEAKEAALAVLAQTNDRDQIASIATVFTDAIAQMNDSDKAIETAFYAERAAELDALKVAARVGVVSEVAARHAPKVEEPVVEAEPIDEAKPEEATGHG